MKIIAGDGISLQLEPGNHQISCFFGKHEAYHAENARLAVTTCARQFDGSLSLASQTVSDTAVQADMQFCISAKESSEPIQFKLVMPEAQEDKTLDSASAYLDGFVAKIQEPDDLPPAKMAALQPYDNLWVYGAVSYRHLTLPTIYSV